MATSPHPVPITHIVAATLHLAAEHHSAGRLAQATALYRDVCGIDPWNADAAFLLSVAMRQRGQTEQSRRLLDRALALDPNRTLFRLEHTTPSSAAPHGHA
ncbi:MAG: tetratricopeptide repeat protein [Acidobacteriaceae bacterium]